MFIGKGLHSIVFSLGFNKVLKIFLDEPDYYTNRIINESKAEKHYMILPKIYKDFCFCGLRCCVIEKLKLKTIKCNTIINILFKHKKDFDGKSILSIVKNNDCEKYAHLMNDAEKFAMKWAVTVRDTFICLGIKELFPGDLTINNIGERNNGDIVYFDP